MNFSIDTFMTQGLHLAKTELLVYALIHNFSQDGQGCYWGSMATTASILNCSEFAVKAALKELTKRNLVKCVGVHPDFRTNEYQAIVPQNLRDRKSTGGVENQPLEGQKINPTRDRKSTPIINNDNKIDNKKSSVVVASIFDRF